MGKNFTCRGILALCLTSGRGVAGPFWEGVKRHRRHAVCKLKNYSRLCFAARVVSASFIFRWLRVPSPEWKSVAWLSLSEYVSLMSLSAATVRSSDLQTLGSSFLHQICGSWLCMLLPAWVFVTYLRKEGVARAMIKRRLFILSTHKEHLGNSRMAKGMVFPLWTFPLWHKSLLLKGILTFFPHTRGNCAKRECCKSPLHVTLQILELGSVRS